jgi:Zn-dependent M28 family amino/carboxypeptidase
MNFTLRFKKNTFISVTVLVIISISGVVYFYLLNSSGKKFNSSRAYRDILYQTALGPRIPGSEAHTREVDWVKNELGKEKWQVETQNGNLDGHPIQNLIAKRGTGAPWIIIGAHYDSRFFADQDPDINNRQKPVPGANDGASGVAVLLELARVLPQKMNKEIWLVFFDAEDQGDINGWNWILGSRYFASHIEGKPDAVVVIDMIGDSNLNIYYETNSDPDLSKSIWESAAKAGYQKQFIPKPKYSVLDDHTPFIEKGIKAADIIDFDYPYYHAIADTSDKVSPVSLKAVGETLINWLDTQ